MNIYEFWLAIKRQAVLLTIALTGLLVLVLFLVFTREGGAFTWRTGPRWEVTIQLAVVPVGTTSLATVDLGPGDLTRSAETFAELLRSAEARSYVSDASGIRLAPDALTVRTGSSPFINLSAIGNSEAEAVYAAGLLVDWLETRLTEPLRAFENPNTTTTIRVAELMGPFESFINVSASESLATAFPDLFLSIEVGSEGAEVIELSRSAGERGLTVSTTLQPATTIRMGVESRGGETLDTVLISAPPMPVLTPTVPALRLVIGDAAITTDGEGSVLLSAEGFSVEWIEGSPLPPETSAERAREINLLVLTENPIPVAIGQRRGPILLIAALTVGTVVILAGAITLDTWQEEMRRAKKEMRRAKNPLTSTPLESLETDSGATDS